MELYTTKKITNVEDFGLAPHDTLPSMHVITSEVIIKVDHNGNFYISESPTDPNCLTHLLKIKKLLCKNTDGKLLDEIIWIKPNSQLIYKKDKSWVVVDKMILNTPVKLQLSVKNNNIYQLQKHCNMYWTVDYVIVDDKFDWNQL